MSDDRTFINSSYRNSFKEQILTGGPAKANKPTTIKMPMVTKFALMNLFSNYTEDSPSLQGLSPYITGCSPKKTSTVRRMPSASSISSSASSSDCKGCPNFDNCGGDPNYNRRSTEKDTGTPPCPPSLREQMIKKLEW